MNLPEPFNHASTVKVSPKGHAYLVSKQGQSLADIPLDIAWTLSQPSSGCGDPYSEVFGGGDGVGEGGYGLGVLNGGGYSAN
jgi:hypothetical protein